MKIKPYLTHDRGREERGYEFWCPGCNQPHRIVTAPARHRLDDGTTSPSWDFDGDPERPTFTPSLMLTYYRGRWEGNRWRANAERVVLCHVDVTAGLLNYHRDCAHDLAGRQGIGMPALPGTREEANLLTLRKARLLHRIELVPIRHGGHHTHHHRHRRDR